MVSFAEAQWIPCFCQKTGNMVGVVGMVGQHHWSE